MRFLFVVKTSFNWFMPKLNLSKHEDNYTDHLQQHHHWRENMFKYAT
jgi:hypothetical protein